MESDPKINSGLFILRTKIFTLRRIKIGQFSADRLVQIASDVWARLHARPGTKLQNQQNVRTVTAFTDTVYSGTWVPMCLRKLFRQSLYTVKMRGSVFLRKRVAYSPNYTASHPTSACSEHSPPWEGLGHILTAGDDDCGPCIWPRNNSLQLHGSKTQHTLCMDSPIVLLCPGGSLNITSAVASMFCSQHCFTVLPSCRLKTQTFSATCRHTLHLNAFFSYSCSPCTLRNALSSTRRRCETGRRKQNQRHCIHNMQWRMHMFCRANRLFNNYATFMSPFT
jgi:hypothetical protein